VAWDELAELGDVPALLLLLPPLLHAATPTAAIVASTPTVSRRESFDFAM
jgi:hypothetical protein